MGYCSALEGRVSISENAYKKMIEEKIRCESHELPLWSCLQEIDYDGTYVNIFSEGKHYYIDEIMSLLAKYKDSEDIDEITYQGEDPGDFGTYYISAGRWCFVLAIVPPPPTDLKKWTYVKQK